jgi:ribosome-binding factor A
MHKLKDPRLGFVTVTDVADIIMHKLKDPRLGFVTVTDAQVSDDLRHAKIYMSVFEEEKKETSLKVLNSSAKYIRNELGKRIKIKFIPDLTFKLDESITYGAKIDQLLEEIQPEKGSSENDENPT